MRIAYLPDAENTSHWEAIEDLLKPAAEMGGIKPKEAEDLIWIAIERGRVWAAFTVRLVGRVLEIRCAGGGRLFDWVAPCEATLTDFARDCGSKALELRGRRGWSRWARKFGWKYDRDDERGSPVFRKDI